MGQSDFKNATGVNLIDYADSFENGSLYVNTVKDGRLIHIVLVRFEDIANWKQIIGTYFPGFEMRQAVNIGRKKWYAKRYEEFLRTYKFSDAEIKTLCAGDTLKFYSAEERQAMAPQCYATSLISPQMVTDSGRIYAIT